MPTTQFLPIPPTTRGSVLSRTDHYYLLMMHNLAPLNEVDTSAGSYGETPPPPGLNVITGRSAQCREIVYVKTSADGNTFTLCGSATAPLPLGPYTMTIQGATLRIKSDGTRWYKSA